MPKLTIGFAHYDDPRAPGVLKDAIISHGYNDVNFVVIDNSPKTNYGKALKDMAGQFGSRVKYVPMDSNSGTTQPRNRIFAEADGDAVLVMDCHVTIYPRAIEHLIRWYDEHPDCQDLLSGPLVYDNGVDIETHFADVWRGQMWGVWYKDPVRGPIIQKWLADNQASGKWDTCPVEPFEIPGMGLGLFTCRRDAWLGFNPHFRGFGGEEMYIHDKYRLAGRKALCLPFLAWWHDFSRPGGIRYRNDTRDRVQNYVIGKLELGKPLDPVYQHFVSLDTRGEPLGKHLIEEHGSSHITPQLVNEAFQRGGDEALQGLHKSVKITEEQWAEILKAPEAPNPDGHVVPLRLDAEPGQPGCTSCQNPEFDGLSLDDVYERLKAMPRDLDQHLPKLKELAEQCDHVTEFTHRRESTVALAAARPKVLIAHLKETDLEKVLHEVIRADAEVSRAIMAVGGGIRRVTDRFTAVAGGDAVQQPTIDETDMLFLDDEPHDAERLWAVLEKHGAKVKRYIVLHDTQLFGEQGEGGKPGYLPALRRWMSEFPEWSVIFHDEKQYGLTVLSRDKRDKPALPSMWTMAKNFAGAVAAHVADGGAKVTAAKLEQRLTVCSMCPNRVESRCSVCGCGLVEKSSWRSSECPIGKWGKEQEEARAA